MDRAKVCVRCVGVMFLRCCLSHNYHSPKKVMAFFSFSRCDRFHVSEEWGSWSALDYVYSCEMSRQKKKGIHLASFLNEHKGMLNVCSACVMFVYAPLVLSHQCGCLGVERYRSRNSKVKMSLVFFLFLL